MTAMPTTAGRGSYPDNNTCGAARRRRDRKVLAACLALSCLSTAVVAAAQNAAEGSSSDVTEAPAATTPLPRPVTVRRVKANPTRESKPREGDSTESRSLVGTSPSTEFGPPAPPSDAGADVASTGDAGAEPAATPSMVTPSAAASVVESSPAAPTASAATQPTEFAVTEVKVRDILVFRLKLEDGGLVPAVRAKRAVRAIEAALADANPESVRTESRQDRVLLFVGSRPIIELTRADAAAIGEGSLELFAASAAARVRDVLENERQRSVVTRSVLSISFVVASGLAVLYVLRLLGMLARRLREFVRSNPERIPAIHLRSIEVVGPHVLRSGIVVGVGVLRLLMQFGLLFTWLLFSSSLFEATRGLTGRLTSLVLTPLSGLATRFAALLPLLLLTTMGVVVLVVLLRFVALFFAGVERGETELSWLRPELAAPTSLLMRIGLVVVSLLVLAPLVTGNVDGSLARVGMLSVVAIVLATTPLVATIVVGLVTLYGDRLKLGDEIRIGEHRGVLVSVDLVELRLTTNDGRQLRIPHLVTLVRPLVIAVDKKPRTRRLVVTAEARFEQLVEILGTAEVFSHAAEVSLAKLESTQTTVELVPKQATVGIEQRLLVEVAREFQAKQIRLVLAEWRTFE